MRTSIVVVDPMDLLRLEETTQRLLFAIMHMPPSRSKFLNFDFRKDRDGSCYARFVIVRDGIEDRGFTVHCNPIDGMKVDDYFYLLGHKVGNLACAMTHGAVTFARGGDPTRLTFNRS